MATKDNNQNSELETNELLSEENAQNADDLNDDKNDNLNQNTDETDEDGTQEQDSDNEDNEQENEEKDNDEKDESVNGDIDDLLPREDFKIERGDTEQSGGDYEIDDLLPKNEFVISKNKGKNPHQQDFKEKLKKALNENISWLEQIKITLLATERLCLSFEKLERHYNEDMKAHNILKDESKQLVGEAKKSFDLITQKLKELENSFQSYNAFLKQTYENFNETLSKNDKYFTDLKLKFEKLCEETNAKSAEVLLFRQNILTAIERLDEVIKSAEELESTMDNGVRK